MKRYGVFRRAVTLVSAILLTASATMLSVSAVAFKETVTSLTVMRDCIKIKPKNTSAGNVLMVGYSAEGEMTACQLQSTEEGSTAEMVFTPMPDADRISFFFTTAEFVPVAQLPDWDGNPIKATSELPEDPC